MAGNQTACVALWLVLPGEREHDPPVAPGLSPGLDDRSPERSGTGAFASRRRTYAGFVYAPMAVVAHEA